MKEKLRVMWKRVGVPGEEGVEGSSLTQGGQGRPLGGNMELRSQNRGSAGPVRSPGKRGQVEEMTQNSVLEYNRHLWNIQRMSVPLPFPLRMSKRMAAGNRTRCSVLGRTPQNFHCTSAAPPLLPLLEDLLCAGHCMKHVLPFSHLRFAWRYLRLEVLCCLF